MSARNLGFWSALATTTLFACSTPPAVTPAPTSESSVKSHVSATVKPTKGTGASNIGRSPTTTAQGAVPFGSSDSPTPAGTGASPTPSATTAASADPGATKANTPSSSPTAAAPSPSPTTPPSPTPSPSTAVGASPPAFSHIRNLVPSVVTETDSTTQMVTVSVPAGPALLIPDGKDIAVINSQSLKVAPYDLGKLLPLTVNNVQALAVSGLKVYAVGSVGGQASLITLTLDATTLAATATSIPLKGVATKKIGGLVLQNATTLIAADTSNAVLDSIAIADGTVTVLAGTPGTPGTTSSGPNAGVQFDHPTSLALVGTTLYCMDSGNSRVLVGDLAASTFSLLFGGTAGQADGAFSTAKVSTPNGFFLDGQTLYIADTGNNTIRMAKLDTKMMSTVTVVQPGAAGLLPFGRGVGVLAGLIYGSDNAGDVFSFKASL